MNIKDLDTSKLLYDLSQKDKDGELHHEDICGEHIGTGAHRKVYVFKYNPDWVVKVARESMGQLMRSKGTPRNGVSSNRKEMEVWRISDKKFRKDWFAPAIWISEKGDILLMQRGERRGRKGKRPKWFKDGGAKNWVTINKKTVICDYGGGDILRYIKKQQK